ncbi:ribonuclease P protein component [Nakamurella sp. DB0629]|uniref:Ribonuclease P protein component n=1 Tax=Nakamurella aerolata TaxID=1656892 RepID=A0A849A8K2_9ACTN|nr:ribonuclease P protein component [Nakamurella aerolata]NNG36889.1 ribonuclease P protein component [Nakamurella aerolata]
MLPVARKLRSSADFTAVVRTGRRAGAARLVVHLRPPATSDSPVPPGRLARAGFVVSKAVGNSVTRHRITRQLRPLMWQRLTALPDGTDVVVRVLPAAAGASSAELAADLDSTVAAASRPGRRRPARPRPAQPGAAQPSAARPARNRSQQHRAERNRAEPSRAESNRAGGSRDAADDGSTR